MLPTPSETISSIRALTLAVQGVKFRSPGRPKQLSGSLHESFVCDLKSSSLKPANSKSEPISSSSPAQNWIRGVFETSVGHSGLDLGGVIVISSGVEVFGGSEAAGGHPGAKDEAVCFALGSGAGSNLNGLKSSSSGGIVRKLECRSALESTKRRRDRPCRRANGGYHQSKDYPAQDEHMPLPGRPPFQ